MLSSFFFHDTAPPEIYTLSLHDALPIFASSIRASTRKLGVRSAPSPATRSPRPISRHPTPARLSATRCPAAARATRSEEHTSELQSLAYLVCPLLLAKKKPTTLLPSMPP